MNISPEEAARALGEIEASRAAMRTAIRSFRGHYQLWLWGAIWAAMALLAQFYGRRGVQLFPWIVGIGLVPSFVLGYAQRCDVRMPVDKRFLGVLVAIIIYSFVWPFVLGWPRNVKFEFAYTALMSMFYYVVAGIWFDTYLLRIGLLVSALIITGLFFFPAIFWLWFAVFGGGTLIGTGFYVRYFWR
jgi:hypothetical protein